MDRLLIVRMPRHQLHKLSLVFYLHPIVPVNPVNTVNGFPRKTGSPRSLPKMGVHRGAPLDTKRCDYQGSGILSANRFDSNVIVTERRRLYVSNNKVNNYDEEQRRYPTLRICWGSVPGGRILASHMWGRNARIGIVDAHLLCCCSDVPFIALPLLPTDSRSRGVTQGRLRYNRVTRELKNGPRLRHGCFEYFWIRCFRMHRPVPPTN